MKSTSFIVRVIISTLLAFYQMSHFLFIQYGEMTLAGKNYNSGIEAGASDVFMYFLFAVVLGFMVWTVSMFILAFAERLLNKRSKAKKEADTDVFHD